MSTGLIIAIAVLLVLIIAFFGLVIMLATGTVKP